MTTKNVNKPTKAILLRLPVEQVEKLEKIKDERMLKNVQSLLYRLIEDELKRS